MCHHFIGFDAFERLPSPKTLWRCSTCGRASRAPIDCCSQPAFATMPQAGMGDAVRQWLHAIASQAVAALATIRQRWQATDPPLCGPADPKPYPDSETADIVRRETDAEAAEPKESMAVPV